MCTCANFIVCGRISLTMFVGHKHTVVTRLSFPSRESLGKRLIERNHLTVCPFHAPVVSLLPPTPSCSLGIAEVWINLTRAEKYPHPSDLDLLSFVFAYRYVIHTQFVCVCVCVCVCVYVCKCVCVKYAHVLKFFALKHLKNNIVIFWIPMFLSLFSLQPCPFSPLLIWSMVAIPKNSFSGDTVDL